jgi:hypothetical protein
MGVANQAGAAFWLGVVPLPSGSIKTALWTSIAEAKIKRENVALVSSKCSP